MEEIIIQLFARHTPYTYKANGHIALSFGKCETFASTVKYVPMVGWNFLLLTRSCMLDKLNNGGQPLKSRWKLEKHINSELRWFGL